MLIGQAHIVGRRDLPHLFMDRGYTYGAEIGVHRGEFASHILASWPGYLLLVDSWKNYPGDKAGEGDRETDFKSCLDVLRPYTNRWKVAWDTSEKAATMVDDESLDFVYIDANHCYESVLQDIRLWWPKVRKGGCLLGHDIVCPWEEGGGWGPGVQRAVFEFFREHTIQLIVETNGEPWSWMVDKI